MMLTVNPFAISIRARKLGLLIHDARLASGRSAEACARAIGVPASEFETYELGEASPSLPQLEALAGFLNAPLEHFWGSRAISEGGGRAADDIAVKLIGLRQRKIGLLVRQARLNAGLSEGALAGQLGISPADLDGYEFGERPLPVPLLEALVAALDRPLEDFKDPRGSTKAEGDQPRSVQDFQKLPPGLQEFVCKPVNRPFLELAQRLSEMDVNKLRAVAEGLLEITL